MHPGSGFGECCGWYLGNFGDFANPMIVHMKVCSAIKIGKVLLLGCIIISLVVLRLKTRFGAHPELLLRGMFRDPYPHCMFVLSHCMY